MYSSIGFFLILKEPFVNNHRTFCYGNLTWRLTVLHLINLFWKFQFCSWLTTAFQSWSVLVKQNLFLGVWGVIGGITKWITNFFRFIVYSISKF